MPRKNNPILNPAELIWSLLIGFNLLFQGMALSLHLYVSHSHEEADPSPREIPHFKADDSHEHEDCVICKVLNTLHHSLAGYVQNPLVFIPFHFEDIFLSFDILTGASSRHYRPRAPTSGPHLTV